LAGWQVGGSAQAYLVCLVHGLRRGIH
jgi:hypothetical protein